ncbi:MULTISPECIES: hypothetical protein [unclassified Halorubrum]|uniref:hypothetical protein n=1 Tax=unclassified Halorubrum TaxID=2642239 RepID=UPI0003DCF81C|nr:MULTISPECIES: hypothetical protein [unclassified Halorubrum]CDK39264.1 hypothetical protein BN903_38 [Halorubrum sp. AJ67]
MSEAGSTQAGAAYCRNCEQQVQPVGGVNRELGIILLFFGFIPGLVYLGGGWIMDQYGLLSKNCPICGDDNWSRQPVNNAGDSDRTVNGDDSEGELVAQHNASGSERARSGVAAKIQKWVIRTIKSWATVAIIVFPLFFFFSLSNVSMLVSTILSVSWFGVCIYGLHRRDLLHFGIHSPFYYREQKNE